MITNHSKEIIIKTISDSHTIYQSTKIAIVVGTVLNIINQGDFIFNMMFENINFFKLGLTYLVPFCVSTYTAIAINIKLKIGEKAIISTNLICKKCKSTLHVEQNTTIPECPKCGLKGLWRAINYVF